MTTIAYDANAHKIAVDSRITSGGSIFTDCADKTLVNKHGVWFFAGSTVDMGAVIKHIDKPETGRLKALTGVDGFSGLVCNHDGVVFEFHSASKDIHVMEVKHSEGYGSGGVFALSAMDFGKSCSEAVEYAMTRDTCTGGNVKIYNCKNNEWE